MMRFFKTLSACALVFSVALTSFASDELHPQDRIGRLVFKKEKSKITYLALFCTQRQVEGERRCLKSRFGTSMNSFYGRDLQGNFTQNDGVWNALGVEFDESRSAALIAEWSEVEVFDRVWKQIWNFEKDWQFIPKEIQSTVFDKFYQFVIKQKGVLKSELDPRNKSSSDMARDDLLGLWLGDRYYIRVIRDRNNKIKLEFFHEWIRSTQGKSDMDLQVARSEHENTISYDVSSNTLHFLDGANEALEFSVFIKNGIKRARVRYSDGTQYLRNRDLILDPVSSSEIKKQYRLFRN